MAEEFNEAAALCHFPLGSSIVNLSVVFGARFLGILITVAVAALATGLTRSGGWRDLGFAGVV
jgi:chromate transporter